MKRMKLIRVNSRHRKNTGNNNNERLDPNSWNNKANIQRRENFENEEVDVLRISRRKAMIKIFLWLALASFLLVAVILILLYCLPISQENSPVTPASLNPPRLPNHQFFKRSDWGARPPKWTVTVTKPVNMVIIKHLRSRTCDTFPSCVSVVATQQSQDARDGHPDIYCNFLIGGDGNVYEGRGWGVQPQYRNDTVDIVYIGTYDMDELTPSMIDAAKVLMADGLNRKYLAEDFIIVCHNQTKPNTLSPGQNIFKEVKTWPRYDPGIYFEKNPESKTAEKHSV